ncbi:uncharacterized protein LOC118745529 [Rhagoletis pomonella]|uniref:uncharacterized protein LOC118745529 n=1 Tax=Rhagoletis pomonella TaxID=28610 RepID=UPI00177CA64B|nr:uncharacterized protein LOC118745529 [Rhagoletis pomonella]
MTDCKSLLEQWNHLAQKLNACGGAIKDGEGWKRAWGYMRSKAKQKSQDLRNSIQRSGVNSSITAKHLSNLDERIIGVMTTVTVVGQTEVGEPLRSSGAVTSVEIFDAPADHLDIEILEESMEEPLTLNMVPEDLLPPQHRAPKRRNCSLEEANTKMIAIEEHRLVLAERKITALENRNSIEERKADALEQTNAILSNIFHKLDDWAKMSAQAAY